MYSETLHLAFKDAIEASIPEAGLTVSEWAEKYRYVSQERVANPALAGRWQNATTPYLVGIMDAANEPGVNEIIFQKSSQVGGTEILNNFCGYYIHQDPAPILYFCESEGKARAWSVEAFAPMLRDTPVLANIFGEAKERDSSNMIEAKSFRGGHFALGWATSPATLSSRPRRVILGDEIDAMIVTKEGDPLKLAEARTKTAGSQRLIVYCSSPRNKETSRIEPLYDSSDARKFFVPCPDCGEFQVLRWSNVVFTDDPSGAVYACDICGVEIDHSEKEWMLSAGEWRATKEAEVPGRVGFWINELYSPFSSWGDMAVAFLDAKKHRDTLKVFVNTRLGETWEDKPEELDFGDISFNREEYENPVPAGVLLLTAGCDVQDDRLEVETVGWGMDFESWSIDHTIIWGSPALPDVWDTLYDHLRQQWESPFGTFAIAAVCIDSGGHHTEQVYRFTKANRGRRWFAVKGASISGKPIVSKPSKTRNRVDLWPVGTDTAKDEIFDFLKVKEPGPGYCHFPAHYDESYFRQLCAEKKETRYRMGVAYNLYVKRSESARNEALDLRVYATAAREILRPNFEKLRERYLQMVSQHIPLEDDPIRKLDDFPAKTTGPRRTGKIGGMISGTGNFATNWR